MLTLSGVASLADYQQVLTTITYSDTASSPTAGDRTINVVANDGIVNSQPAVATVTVAAGPAPNGYTITADHSLINAAEATSASFTFAGATVGDTYNYTVTSSGGGDAVTGSGTVSSATQQVTGINVSSLPDGTLTYSVTLTDAAGNTGIAATATATLDTDGADRLLDHGRPKHDRRQPGRRGQLHLRRRGSGRHLQLHRHQRRRQRLGDRQRHDFLGHPAGHRHQRLVAARRHPHLQRDADRRGRQRRRLRGGHGHAGPDRAGGLYDHRRPEPDQRQPGHGRRASPSPVRRSSPPTITP